MKPDTKWMPDIKWMIRIPETEEECLQALQREDKRITSCLQGIFRCRLNKGDKLLEAYEKALIASLPEHYQKRYKLL